MEIIAHLWSELFLACVHITNSTATTSLRALTTLEAFLDQVDPDFKDYQSHEPDLCHLRTLGCRANVLIPEEKRMRS